MRLKLEELQKVVKKTIKEERSHLALRDELYKLLGPSILVSNSVERIAQVANEQIDVVEATGREVSGSGMKLSVLVEAAGSSSQHVRKVAARLLPEKMVTKMLLDPSSSVRCAAASRLPYSLVKESVKRYPGDDQLRTIARLKKLEEAGIPKPTPVDEPFDMYGDEKMGAASKTQVPMKELPDTWYERVAHKLCAEYNNNLERQWEEVLATRFASSYYATSGVKLDRDKLLKAIYKCLEARDEAVLGENTLKSIAQRLREDSHLDDAVMPIVSEEVDPITSLLGAGHSASKYISEAEALFSIRKSYVPAGIKKYNIGEGKRQETQVPVKGSVPSGGFTSCVEEALDRYVDSWNKRQSLEGEPYVLSWYPHPTSSDSIGFNLELK